MDPKNTIDRRRFLTTLALGAGVAPMVSFSKNFFAAPQATRAAAGSMCYDSKRLLQPGDISYLGAMRVPASGADMTFSYGSLTGRRVGGAVRLLMGGNVLLGDQIHEFADTGSYNPDL